MSDVGFWIMMIIMMDFHLKSTSTMFVDVCQRSRRLGRQQTRLVENFSNFPLSSLTQVEPARTSEEAEMENLWGFANLQQQGKELNGNSWNHYFLSPQSLWWKNVENVWMRKIFFHSILLSCLRNFLFFFGRKYINHHSRYCRKKVWKSFSSLFLPLQLYHSNLSSFQVPSRSKSYIGKISRNCNVEMFQY